MYVGIAPLMIYSFVTELKIYNKERKKK